MDSIHSCEVFKKHEKAQYDNKKSYQCTPRLPQNISSSLNFEVTYDGRHKARLVADGHFTAEPVESIFSGVASLRNLRLVIFLGKLNNLELWGADIGNAYLEAVTEENYILLLDLNLNISRDISLLSPMHLMD